MPYSAKELLNNDYFQALENAEYVEYEAQQQRDRTSLLISGSNSNGSMELRDSTGAFISYENPETQLGQQGPWQEIIVPYRTIKVKSDATLGVIIDREIKEL